MEVYAITKFARMSPEKARDLARSIQGLPVAEALSLTAFTRRKAALLIGKTLRSAIANAENNADLSADDLYVKEALIDQGPIMRRFWPRARGMVSPVKRKMSHIKITLSDEKPAASKRSKRGKE